MTIKIVDVPINSMVIFHSYVKLPEGIQKNYPGIIDPKQCGVRKATVTAGRPKIAEPKRSGFWRSPQKISERDLKVRSPFKLSRKDLGMSENGVYPQ